MKNIHKEEDINIDIETIFDLINDIESKRELENDLFMRTHVKNMQKP